MNSYGQAITWSTPAAPHIFTGHCTNYSYRDTRSQQLLDDEVGDFVALVLHSHKAELSFAAEITDGSIDFLDLSGDNAAIVVSGISGGVVLCSRAVERWRLGQRKSASITATHYPDIVQASPALAGVEGNAFTPDQAALGIVTPGAQLIYGTYGLGHASGVVHGLTIEQILTITEDDPSPDGKILSAHASGYQRQIELEVLALPSTPIPATGTTLALTGADDMMAADYKITAADVRFQNKRGKMYAISAVWIPPFSA